MDGLIVAPYEHEVIRVEGPTNGIGAALLINRETNLWEAVMILDPVPPLPMDRYVISYTYEGTDRGDAVKIFNALCNRHPDTELEL